MVLGRFFADTARWWVVPLILVLLAADMAAWSVYRSSVDPFMACMEVEGAEQPCVGEEMVFSIQFVKAIYGPDRFRVGRVDGSIQVLGPSEGLSVGQEVTVGGLRTAEGLEASLVQTHPGRPWKRRLGWIGSAVMLGLVLLVFTVRHLPEGWRVVPRWRRDG